MNEELMQEIKGTLPWLLVAAIAVGGWYGWKNYSANKRQAASEAVVNSFTVEELEEASDRFGSSDAGGAIKLRLAKKYFDTERFQEALDLYEALLKDSPDGFADVPVVGKAQCLEALGKFAEAKKAFADYAEQNPKSYLALSAKLGVARTTAEAGDKDGALKYLATLKDSVKDDLIAKMRVEATEDVVKRYKK